MDEQWAEQRVRALTKGFTYEVEGDETLEEIIALAREDWDGWEAVRPSHHVRPNDDGLAVDFLRHQRTAYEWQLDQIAWRQGGVKSDELTERAAEIVRARTLEAIEAKYPELKEGVVARRRSNYVVSGGQRVRVGRSR